jgi:hypothetical protein
MRNFRQNCLLSKHSAAIVIIVTTKLQNMSLPTDRDSLLAAWEAICPCQPLPHEVEGILLASFKLTEFPYENTIRMLATEHSDSVSPPPSRFTRQPRAKKTAPLGPTGSTTCLSSEAKSSCMPSNVHPNALKSNLMEVSYCCYGVELIAKGPRDDECNN